MTDFGPQSQPQRPSAASLNAPSGIAQLRKTSEQHQSQPEPMNLDDFINNENVGTPAGLALTPSAETSRMAEDKSAGMPGASSSAIPIKTRKDKEPTHLMVPQSVPVAAHLQRGQDEFGYIPRHPRKTSIDETNRRVSVFFPWLYMCTCLRSLSGLVQEKPCVF